MKKAETISYALGRVLGEIAIKTGMQDAIEGYLDAVEPEGPDWRDIVLRLAPGAVHLFHTWRNARSSAAGAATRPAVAATPGPVDWIVEQVNTLLSTDEGTQMLETLLKRGGRTRPVAVPPIPPTS